MTVMLGGNDDGLFVKLIDTCSRVAKLDPTGAPCRGTFAGGSDDPLVLADVARTRVREMLGRIAVAAPRARIVVVGYPAMFPTRTCATLGFAAGDARYAHEVIADLDTSIAAAARESGASFVDTRRVADGHDICADDPWFSGYAPTARFPVAWHPDEVFMRAVARQVLASLDTGTDTGSGASGSGR